MRLTDYLVKKHLQPEGNVVIKNHALYLFAKTDTPALKEGKIAEIGLSGMVKSSEYMLNFVINPELAESAFLAYSPVILPGGTTPLSMYIRPTKDIDVTKLKYLVSVSILAHCPTWQDLA